MKRISMLFILLLAVSTAFAQLNLKIMSYNVRNGKGMDGVHNLQRVADAINRSKADIVAVQELDSMTNRSGKKYVLGEIAALTNMHPEYFPAIEFNGGKYGIGILSKKKPISVKGYNLPGREEKRGILVAEFNQFLFACTHLSLTEEDRMA
jgi:endonuclease/exonuclease/phosphatase family metal-dependent hydrolase